MTLASNLFCDPAAGRVLGVPPFGFKLGDIPAAAIDSHMAPGVERTAGRRIDRAGHLPAQHNPLMFAVRDRLRDGR